MQQFSVEVRMLSGATFPFDAAYLRIIEGGRAATPQVTPQVPPQVEMLLAHLHGEVSRQQLMDSLGLRDRKNFASTYLLPAIQAGVIEMTIPDKPNSRLQKYRLTAAGRARRDEAG